MRTAAHDEENGWNLGEVIKVIKVNDGSRTQVQVDVSALASDHRPSIVA